MPTPLLLPSCSFACALRRRPQVPKLLEGVAARSAQHREMMLRLAVAGLRAYAVLPPAHRLGSEADFASRRGEA